MSVPSSGPGWGAIEHRRLTVLVLGASDHRGRNAASAIARAVGLKHSTILLAPERGGLIAKLSATRTASERKPELIHSVGTRGVARAAGSIAAGLGVPLIASLVRADLADRRHVARIAAGAKAIVLEEEADADAFRGAGIGRELYVTASPDPSSSDGDRFYLGAIEVVYGRVLFGAETEPAEELVRIGPIDRGAR